MACNCNKPSQMVPVNPHLPGVAELYPQPSALTEEDYCPARRIASTPSEGYMVPSAWTDAAPLPEGEGATILARKGGRLFRFTGSGFLQVINGQAKVVKSVAMKLTDMWHEWWKPAGVSKKPVLGAPFPAPFHVIADSQGGMHLIQGIQGESVTRDSIEVWNVELSQWETRDVADFPALAKGRIPQSSALEITGFQAIAANAPADTVRGRAALTGEGLFRLKKVATVAAPDCECEGCAQQEAFSYVTEFIPNPVDEGDYKLRCTVDEDGVASYEWVADS